MLQQVRNTITERGLVQSGDILVASVSGGADSVAMTYALHYLAPRLDFSLLLAHLDHGIRDEASRADARFVRLLGWKLGVPAVLERADVPALANAEGLSLEMAARSARQAFLRRVAETVGASSVAVGHTHDDVAETFVLRMTRGAGRRGLGALAYANDVAGLHLVRPLRDVTHEQACAFLKDHGLAWCEDETNTEDAYLRNRVRHEVLPLMEKRLNPRVRDILVQEADILREEDAWLDEQARVRLAEAAAKGKKAALEVRALQHMAVPMRRRVLMQWLIREGVNPDLLTFSVFQRLEHLAASTRGTQQVQMPGRHAVVRRYGALHVVTDEAHASFSRTLRVPGEMTIPEAELHVACDWHHGAVMQRDAKLGQWPAEVTLRADRLAGGRISLRSWEPGDRIRPLGMKGSKKIQDLFVDEKIPRDLRWRIPVVEAEGEIIWIPGYQVARGWDVRASGDRSLHVRIDAVP